ncbi:hypothetical protein D3C84_885620 [compost metagenome]
MFPILAQLVAFALQRTLDAAVDGTLALAQPRVLFALGLVVAQRGLQLGAQLANLRDQGRDGVARRVAFDAKRLGFLGRQVAARLRWGGCVIVAGEQLEADEHQQQCQRDHQPLEQAITVHCGLPRRRPRLAALAG